MFFTSPKVETDKVDELTRLTANDLDDNDDIRMTLEEKAKQFDQQTAAAGRLSIRLLNATNDEDEDRILRESLDISDHHRSKLVVRHDHDHDYASSAAAAAAAAAAALFAPPRVQIYTMIFLVVVFFAGLATMIVLGVRAVGPPSRPVGPYQLVERQEGMEFFDYYTFYEGRDSVGSNGFNTYISEASAFDLGVVNVTMEKDVLDMYASKRKRRLEEEEDDDDDSNATTTTTTTTTTATSKILNSTISNEELEVAIKAQNYDNNSKNAMKEEEDLIMDSLLLPPIIIQKEEPFLYMKSAPTPAGPRDAIRLEGKRRFNRGLFILDLRHMPAGCGVWPAFWLTDEANWPVNGEIDIVEGVNYQSVAKTALHSTQGCRMDDVPLGVKTGTWDEAIGIPDGKTGIPDMTLRHATDCFVYNPHQWLNQGCVAVDAAGDSLGIPLNNKGGGVYVLEWDPENRHIRAWVFSPHKVVPENLRDTIRTASEADADDRVKPDPSLWPLPYGYFAIGENTNCHASHFKNMRLVFNLAFCGSVAGNRFQMDCPIQAKKFATCNDWVSSDPEELKEAYWKIRGVYVYEREWEHAWM